MSVWIAFIHVSQVAMASCPLGCVTAHGSQSNPGLPSWGFRSDGQTDTDPESTQTGNTGVWLAAAGRSLVPGGRRHEWVPAGEAAGCRPPQIAREVRSEDSKHAAHEGEASLPSGWSLDWRGRSGGQWRKPGREAVGVDRRRGQVWGCVEQRPSSDTPVTAGSRLVLVPAKRSPGLARGFPLPNCPDLCPAGFSRVLSVHTWAFATASPLTLPPGPGEPRLYPRSRPCSACTPLCSKDLWFSEIFCLSDPFKGPWREARVPGWLGQGPDSQLLQTQRIWTCPTCSCFLVELSRGDRAIGPGGGG